MRIDKRDIAEWVNHTVGILRPMILHEIEKEVRKQLNEALSKEQQYSYGGIDATNTERTYCTETSIS